MREADERALAEIRADNPDLTDAEIDRYREQLALIPDEINTRFVVTRRAPGDGTVSPLP